MIHVVTQKSAVVDCLTWLESGDQLLLLGEAVAEFNGVAATALNNVIIAAFSDDAERYGCKGITRITGETLIEWLEASPCRTWS